VTRAGEDPSTEEDEVSRDLEETLKGYEDLVGYVPDGIRARLTLLSDLSPEFLERLERIRGESVEPQHIDAVTVQMLMFAILLVARDTEARAHARIALRKGATPEQLLDVIGVAGWLGGAQAYNMGFRSLQQALADERAAEA
jgi:alkylhydroperoxidase/carboxymuconolactone decarboxylase family protein YurZ